jgi:hypothetical protein
MLMCGFIQTFHYCWWTLCFFLVNLSNNLNCTCIYVRVLHDFWLIPHPVVIWLIYGSMKCDMYVWEDICHASCNPMQQRTWDMGNVKTSVYISCSIACWDWSSCLLTGINLRLWTGRPFLRAGHVMLMHPRRFLRAGRVMLMQPRRFLRAGHAMLMHPRCFLRAGHAMLMQPRHFLRAGHAMLMQPTLQKKCPVQERRLETEPINKTNCSVTA